DIVVLQRDQLPVGGCAQPHALLCAGAMTDRLEHHLAADHELDRLAQLPRRRGGERTVRPWPQLASKARTEKLRDDADILSWQAEHLREHAPEVEYPLPRFVQRQCRSVPDCGRRVQLDGV